MATLIRRPNGDGYYTEWTPNSGTTHYTQVDETSYDSDTTYVKFQYVSAAGKDSYTLDNSGSVPAGSTINSVTFTGVFKRQSGLAFTTVKFGFRWAEPGREWDAYGGNYTLTTSYATKTQVFTTNPHSSSAWTVDEVNSTYLQALICNNNMTEARCTQVYITIDYTEPAAVGNHDAPTDLQVEKISTPTYNAFERPSFRAKFQAEDDSATAYAHQAWIIVSTSPSRSTADGTDSAWSSGWFSMAQHGSYPGDNSYCPSLPYYNTAESVGFTLSSDPEPYGGYYYIMAFKDTANDMVSDWSSTAFFKVVKREWADSAYAFRQKITFGNNHPELPAGNAIRFNFKTGNREIIARNAHFNEGIQASGGSQVAYFDNKTHVVYLSYYGNNKTLNIYIVSKDHTTGEWGDPFFVYPVASTYDTHYFPCIAIDKDGYIHIFISSHVSGGGSIYLRSSSPNISGSLPGESITNVWIGPSTGTTVADELMDVHECAYPVAWVDKRGRIYLATRGYVGTDYYYKYIFSDDNGETWSDIFWFIYDNGEDYQADAYKTYCYGFKYDPKQDRLHLGYTFNSDYAGNNYGGYPTGIWYAYSDYNPNSRMGFDSFYSANGVWGGKATSAVTDVFYCLKRLGPTADACAIATACSLVSSGNARFIQDLLVCGDGNPIVFWEQKFKFREHAAETNSFCAKWDGSNWGINNITQQTGLKQRVRRSGIAGYVDNDNAIHIFYPVSSNTYFTQLPNTDEIKTAVGYSNGTDAYELINNSAGAFNGDDEYIYFNDSSGYAYFSSTAKFNGDTADVKVLEVEVEALVKNAGYSTHNLRLVLYSDDSSSGYNARSFSLTAANSWYDRYRGSFSYNPFTPDHASWKVDEACNIWFGIESDSDSTANVTRLHKRIKHTRNASEKLGSCEIFEFVSTSDGDRWNTIRRSKNSTLGIPIMNYKFDYSNNEGEIVWVAGKNLLYMSTNDDEYGRMDYTGDDIKIYYGETEIDRVVDYPNLKESKIIFKLQEIVPANRIAGEDDYYLYYGNKNESSCAKSDPENIYFFYQGFEEYRVGTYIDSSNSVWKKDAGATIRINDSPTTDSSIGTTGQEGHSNKVYAGNKSLYTYSNNSGGVILRADLSTSAYSTASMTNVYLEGSFWGESGGSSRYIQVLDSAGNIFAVGASPSTHYSYYYDGSSWHTALPFSYPLSWSTIGIYVHPSGCSGWLNGERICSNIPIVHSADSIKLVAEGINTTYWDEIKAIIE